VSSHDARAGHRLTEVVRLRRGRVVVVVDPAGLLRCPPCRVPGAVGSLRYSRRLMPAPDGDAPAGAGLAGASRWHALPPAYIDTRGLACPLTTTRARETVEGLRKPAQRPTREASHGAKVHRNRPRHERRPLPGRVRRGGNRGPALPGLDRRRSRHARGRRQSQPGRGQRVRSKAPGTDASDHPGGAQWARYRRSAS